MVFGADPKWLCAHASEIRRSIIMNVQESKVDHVLESVYAQTHANPDSETSKGWAYGPCTEEEIVRKHGPTCVPCRRFGLDQGKKIRLIDNVSKR